MITKLFKNANIYTPIDKGEPAAGREQSELNHFPNGAMLVENGIIKTIGDEKLVRDEIVALYPRNCVVPTVIIDCGGRLMMPGFVDPHTHICFAATREAEFEMRMQGTPYLEILAQGGGILASVQAVRGADEADLYANTRKHALDALKLGTTTLEIKSGYGLDTLNELKMLHVIDQISRTTPLDVAPTFMGAHAIPSDFKNHADGYIDLVMNEMLPSVKAQGVARFCDIFCEQEVFTLEQSRKVLLAAQELGLASKIHADEVHDLGGAGLAAEIGAISADHLLAANEANLEKMADAGVTAVLLPATAYSLRKPYAHARAMIAKNLPVALATDCNPGSSFTESMPFVIGLAVVNMKMTPAEALTAATLNGAYAIGMAPRVGSLDIGKQADFILTQGQSPAILAYHAGVSPVCEVYKMGEKAA